MTPIEALTMLAELKKKAEGRVWDQAKWYLL